MDTRDELARDEWWQNHLDQCGTCIFTELIKGVECCGLEGTEHYREWISEIGRCDNWMEAKRPNYDRKTGKRMGVPW